MSQPPPSRPLHPLRQLAGERGQASVEMVAVLPAVMLVALVVWQLALSGHALWLCANAARVAARAEAVGGDSRAAARSALPSSLERGLRVDRHPGEDAVRVRLRLPILISAWESPITVSASASLGGGGESGAAAPPGSSR